MFLPSITRLENNYFLTGQHQDQQPTTPFSAYRASCTAACSDTGKSCTTQTAKSFDKTSKSLWASCFVFGVLPCNTSTIKELTIVWVSEEVLVTGLGELGVGTMIGAGGRTIYIFLAFSFTTGGFVAVV
jgi:hypothetical protein